MTGITIRKEQAGDRAGVRNVNILAFGGDAEADIVDSLRDRGAAELSLVAELQGAIVGHVMYSVVTIDGDVPGADTAPSLLALAPLSVLPPHQRSGIGSRLVRESLEKLRGAGHGVVIVVGDAEYYPRFGFVPASRFGMRCPFAVRDEVFMLLELHGGALAGRRGMIRYQPELLH